MSLSHVTCADCNAVYDCGVSEDCPICELRERVDGLGRRTAGMVKFGL